MENFNSLTIYDLGCVLGCPVMTDRGLGFLKSVKTSGHHCTVSFDTNYQHLYYSHEIMPILKPMPDVNVARVTIKVLTEVAMKHLREGYDALEWIEAGLAMDETGITS